MGILFIITIIINILMSFTRRHNKYVAILSIVILSLVMGYASTESGDLRSYEAVYYNIASASTTHFEIGYIWIMELFSGIGVSFDIFRTSIFILGVFLMYLTIKDHTQNYHLIVVLYAISVFYFMSVTIRYYIAFSVVVFALKFLYKRKWLIYVGLIMLATLFHKAVIFALVFLLAMIPQKKQNALIKCLVAVNAVGLLLIVLMVFDPSIINSTISTAFHWITKSTFSGMEEMATSYYYGKYSRIYSLYSISYLINLALLYYSSKYLADLNQEIDAFRRTSVIIGLLCGLLMPTLILTQTMMRLVFFGLFVCFITYAKTSDKMLEKRMKFTIGRVAFSRINYTFLALVSSFIWYAVIYLRHDLGFNMANFLFNNKLF